MLADIARYAAASLYRTPVPPKDSIPSSG